MTKNFCSPVGFATLALVSLSSCGGGGSSAGAASASGSVASAAGVLCNYATSAFNTTASVNATATATWSCSGSTRSLSANGLPDHAVGIFPNSNNPNTITAQNVVTSMPLMPTLTNVVTVLGGPLGDIAHILNGVKVDASTAGSCNNAGSTCSMAGNVGPWSIEALGQSSFRFGTDSNNAHVQPNGAYHYHGMPEGFIAKLGKGVALTLVGWAADGFPIYARYGYTVATDASSAIKVIKSSYQLKTTVDASRPATSLYAMGTFAQDYQYVAGFGDLDECNGRTGVTPEFPNGTYHYYATDSYPYLQRCIKGSR